MPCSIWFTFDDKSARRGEFVCNYIHRFPSSQRVASRVTESILETQDLTVDDNDVLRVYLFPDNDPATKPAFARDVLLSWMVTYDTKVVEEFENDA